MNYTKFVFRFLKRFKKWNWADSFHFSIFSFAKKWMTLIYTHFRTLGVDFTRKFRAKFEYSGEWGRLSGTSKSNPQVTSGFKIYNEFGEFWLPICQDLRRFFPVKLALKFLFAAKAFFSLIIQFEANRGRKLHVESHLCPRPVPWEAVSQYLTIECFWVCYMFWLKTVHHLSFPDVAWHVCPVCFSVLFSVAKSSKFNFSGLSYLDLVCNFIYSYLFLILFG